MNNLIIRALTGIFILVFILGGIWLHPITFAVVGFVIMVASLIEFYKLLSVIGLVSDKIAGVAIGIIIYLISLAVSAGMADSMFFMIVIPAVILFFIFELYRTNGNPFANLANTLLGVIYISLPFALMPFSAFSHSGTFSPLLLVGFFILLWTYDSAAYLIGTSIGRHRLFERISPKKSWEGAIGGIMIAMVAGRILSGWLSLFSATEWIILAALISLFATFGDLFQSLLKREAGVKDSGSVMPGHGGFLDRFDGFLFAFPVTFIFLQFFG
ncbi:MAG: phosphatidate cytidylyltransferase [Bacteroidales bacterium]|nr:phosphatidate cytidylyltransferase [Bacteroidales bacterium]